MFVKRMTNLYGFEYYEAVEGMGAIREARRAMPDIVLIALSLPGMDGYEVTTRLKSMPELAKVPVVAVGKSFTDEERERALITGCAGVVVIPSEPHLLYMEIKDYFTGKRQRLEPEREVVLLRQHTGRLVQRLEGKLMELEGSKMVLEHYVKELEETYLNILHSLSNAMEAKDQYTAGHSERVTEWSVKIGNAMGVSRGDLNTIEISGRLHDIGKLVIDRSYIRKPGKLTDEEWAEMKMHPIYSSMIIEPLKFLKDAYGPVRHHHERFGGGGYPDGLKDGEASILTWIVSGADSLDAMMSARSYKRAYGYVEAARELRRCSGTQFHPEVVDAVIRIFLREQMIPPDWDTIVTDDRPSQH